MSNFLRKGRRESIRKDNKGRMKEVNSILKDLEIIAVELIRSGVQISEDNLKEEAEKYTDRPIGKLEQSILLSKLRNFEVAIAERTERIKKARERAERGEPTVIEDENNS